MARKSYPSDKQDQFMLRLPPGMRDQIKRSADDSGRSMNAEIVDTLREFFPVDPSIDEIVVELEQTLSMFEVIRDSIEATGRVPGGEMTRLIARLQSINEDVYKFMDRERLSPVAMLNPEAVEGIEKLLAAYDLPTSMAESVISNLILMSVERVLNKEGRLKVRIGEGAEQRVVEIDYPDEGNAKK